MKNLPEDELFSAYLDGELTADEQAKVEQLLARSPGARRLMDELRALRTTLQSLPAHKLQEDLTQKVLRAAERRMLTEPSDASQGDNPSFWRPIVARLARPRNLLWPLAATAAAMLIYVAGSGLWSSKPTQPGGQPIAMGPQAPDNKPANIQADKGNTPGTGAKVADEHLVVRVSVSPEALEQGLLDKVLEKRQITEKRAVGELALEAVLTPAQLDAALADLKAQPKAFLDAKVDPPKKTANSGKPDPRSMAAKPVLPGIPGVRVPLPPPPEKPPVPKADAKRRVFFLLEVVPSQPKSAETPAEASAKPAASSSSSPAAAPKSK